MMDSPYRSDNIPIIFIPGTSGSSLDINLNDRRKAAILDTTTTSVRYRFLGDSHDIAGNIVTHTARTFNYDPAKLDPAGPRVWIGPEAVGYLTSDLLQANRGNHYFDVLKFADDGSNTLSPQIRAGTVLDVVNVLTLDDLPIYSYQMYAPLMNLFTSPRPGGLGRTIYDTPASNDPNGIYRFAFDWRVDLSTQVDKLNTFIENVRMNTGSNKVTLITHSLGGVISRAYYLNPEYGADQKLDQIISIGGGFGGIVVPIKILTFGDTWGFGFSIGTISVGLAEWETQDLAQNWGTAYHQIPNSEDWFFDDTKNGGIYDRSYIRASPQTRLDNYQDSMNWITLNYNTALTNQAVNFFAGFQPSLGDFREPSTITHHRVIGKGKQTVIAVLLSNGLTDAAYYAITSGEPISNPQMLTPVMSGEPLYGDGDGTVPYHGLLGHTAQVNDVYTDIRVYVIDGAEHVSMIQREDVLKLIKYLLDGVVASQPGVHQRVQNVPTDADLSDIISPNDLPEVTDPSQLH